MRFSRSNYKAISNGLRLWLGFFSNRSCCVTSCCVKKIIRKERKACEQSHITAQMIFYPTSSSSLFPLQSPQLCIFSHLKTRCCPIPAHSLSRTKANLRICLILAWFRFFHSDSKHLSHLSGEASLPFLVWFDALSSHLSPHTFIY